MFFALLLICSYILKVRSTEVQADPSSLQGNVEAVCHYIANGLSSYGGKFVRYPLPPSCREYAGNQQN